MEYSIAECCRRSPIDFAHDAVEAPDRRDEVWNVLAASDLGKDGEVREARTADLNLAGVSLPSARM